MHWQNILENFVSEFVTLYSIFWEKEKNSNKKAQRPMAKIQHNKGTDKICIAN